MPTERDPGEIQKTLRDRPEAATRPTPQVDQSSQTLSPPEEINNEIRFGFSWDEYGQKYEIFGNRSGGITRKIKVEHIVGTIRPSKVTLQ